MAISETVERSVRVRGSSTEWLPVVQENFVERGYRCISVDESAQTLTAVFGDVPVTGSISVILTPAPNGDTDISVSSEVTLGNTAS